MKNTITNLKLDIHQCKTQTDKLLSEFLAIRVDRAAKIDVQYKKLLEITARQILRGGKRMRPYLAQIGYQIAGGDSMASIQKAAIALELFHSYLLIHDDIMDRDDRRHGGANVTGVYKKHFAKDSIVQAEHGAISMAILAGDVTSGLCMEALLEAEFDAAKTLRAIERLNKAIFEVAAGQQLDVLASVSTKSVTSAKNILKISRYKTAGYSITFPLQFGAILASNKPGGYQAMARYGDAVGVAFQLTDDILGMFGSEKILGKPGISDLREGKQTMLMHYGMVLASSAQKATLQEAFGNPNTTKAQHIAVREILELNGARAKTAVLAYDLLQKALVEIPAITTETKLQLKLEAFAKYCVHRRI